MAQPTWTSLDPLSLDLSTGVLEVGRGDWQQGKGNAEPLISPKWAAQVEVDGRVIHGGTPGMPSVPADKVYSWETPWDRRLTINLKSLGFADGKPHTARVRVFAATFFKGWGDAPEDRWEWGHTSAKDDSPAVLEKQFSFGAPPTDPTGDMTKLNLKNTGINAVLDRLERLFDEHNIEEPDGIDALRKHLTALGTKINELVDALNRR
jgi:hypothetical protein